MFVSGKPWKVWCDPEWVGVGEQAFDCVWESRLGVVDAVLVVLPAHEGRRELHFVVCGLSTPLEILFD